MTTPSPPVAGAPEKPEKPPVDWAHRRRHLLIGTVLSLLVIAIVESYVPLMSAAQKGGRHLPWLWPVTLDVFTIADVLVYWDLRATRGDPKMIRMVRAIFIATTFVSAGLQVLDALDAKDVRLGVATGAWTPIAVWLLIEVAMKLAYGKNAVQLQPRKPRPKPRHLADTPPLPLPPASRNGQHPAPEPSGTALYPTPEAAFQAVVIEQRRPLTGPGKLTGGAFGKLYGRSEPTGRRDLARLREEMSAQ